MLPDSTHPAPPHPRLKSSARHSEEGAGVQWQGPPAAKRYGCAQPGRAAGVVSRGRMGTGAYKGVHAIAREVSRQIECLRVGSRRGSSIENLAAAFAHPPAPRAIRRGGSNNSAGLRDGRSDCRSDLAACANHDTIWTGAVSGPVRTHAAGTLTAKLLDRRKMEPNSRCGVPQGLVGSSAAAGAAFLLTH
jgi:hypothetical protein